METISNTLFWISNGLLVPVVVLLLLFFLRAIILPSPPQLVQIVRTPGRRCLLRTPACQL